MKKLVYLFIILFSTVFYSQTNAIEISATLNTDTHELFVQQTIVYHNTSSVLLDSIYLHNWPNSFRDRHTALSKRLLTDYKKDLYFSKEKDRGKNTIKNIAIDYSPVTWNKEETSEDIIKIKLKRPLKTQDSIKITATYVVKIPKDQFTRYGRNNTSYNLRFWYLVPAVYNNGWQTMSNLNMDDLFMKPSNYTIHFTLPKAFHLQSQLLQTKKENNTQITYLLKGEKAVDIDLVISKKENFEKINTGEVIIASNLGGKKLKKQVKKEVLKRALDFMASYLNKYPHKKMLISKLAYKKNPVYGLSQLPSFLAPFSDVFEWDIKMFKVLSRAFIENTLILNKRTDAWILDGLQTYLMIKYVDKFYPELKFVGNISKIWGVRSYTFAQMDFNDKYPFIYQTAARANIDQSLTTRADSLSNFNRKIVNKYKAGLGLQYLDEYLQDSIIPKTIKTFYKNNTLKIAEASAFNTILKQHSNKNIDWFFNDYLKSKKKIDYTIKKVEKTKDSIKITIKNKRNFSAPVALFGVKDKEVKFKKWYTIDTTKTITIAQNGFDRVGLNYRYSYPEINLRDNWKSLEKRILNKPLQIRTLKDAENPYYNQVFLTPTAEYNYYDGLAIGLAIANKTLLRKDFVYKITPTYSTKSKNLTGSFSLLYRQFVENSKVRSYRFGVTGSYFHYDKDLTYQTFSPFVNIYLKRKSLRDPGGSSINFSYKYIDKEPNPAIAYNPEELKYQLFSVNYTYAKPEIIQDFRYRAGLQIAKKFSKVDFLVHYRKLTDSNRQFDFRWYAGAFLSNKTTSDFFSFGLHTPSDYSFQYKYFGRSETTGFFSQQIVIAEGGFKSKLPTNFANQWITTFNSSVGLWRWLEVYNDVGFVKSKNTPVYFAYENGVRFNFVHNILEIYFPVYSNYGWEISQPKYATKIRFVLVLNTSRIIKFFRRGFF